jgi:tetratricopeptide (TPR) repeat protein
VADVAITVEPKGGGGAATSGITNKKGRYKASIDGTAGTYVFRLEKAGFAPTVRELELQEGMVTTATLMILTAPELAVEEFNQGAQALQNGSTTAALAKFDEAIRLDPTLAQAYLGIAVIYHNRKQWGKAAAALESLQTQGRAGVEAPPLIAYETYLNTGDTAKRAAAKARLLGAPDAKDGAVVAYNEAVRLYRTKQEAPALELLAEARELDPQRAEIFQTSAAIHFNKGEFKQALPYLDRAVALDPANLPAQRMLVFSCYELGDRARAESALRAWSSQPGQAEAAAKEVLDQGEKRFESDQYPAARGLAEMVLAVNPENPKAHYLLGRILVASGEVARGKQELERFIELAPADVDAAAAKAMVADL